MAAKVSKKASTKSSKTRRTRKLKTKKGIDRQTSSLLAPTKKRRRSRKKMPPAKKLAARKSKLRQAKRKTVKDKIFDNKRSTVNAKRRAAKKGKVVVSKKGSKTKHKFISAIKKGANWYKKKMSHRLIGKAMGWDKTHGVSVTNKASPTNHKSLGGVIAGGIAVTGLGYHAYRTHKKNKAEDKKYESGAERPTISRSRYNMEMAHARMLGGNKLGNHLAYSVSHKYRNHKIVD